MSRATRKMLRTKATTTARRRRPLGYSASSRSSDCPSISGTLSPAFSSSPSFSDTLPWLFDIEGVREREGSEPAGDARVVAADAICTMGRRRSG